MMNKDILTQLIKNREELETAYQAMTHEQKEAEFWATYDKIGKLSTQIGHYKALCELGYGENIA